MEGYFVERSEGFGFTKELVKECLRLPRRKAQKKQESIPKRPGKSANEIPTTLSTLEKEVKQLLMENKRIAAGFSQRNRKSNGKSQVGDVRKKATTIKGPPLRFFETGLEHQSSKQKD